MRTLVTAGFLTLGLPITVWAADLAGNDSGLTSMRGLDLKIACASPQTTQNFANCVGYVEGTLDALRMMKVALGWGLFCEPPAGLTPIQATLMTNKYLSEHPETLHLAAASIVATVLADAFPCPKPTQ